MVKKKKPPAKKRPPSALGRAIMMLASANAQRHTETLKRFNEIASVYNDYCFQIRALKSGQSMLSERLQSLIGIVEHCDRLVKEKETLQKRCDALTALNDANKYLSAPLVKWHAPQSVFGDSIGVSRPPVACDHDILSPHATIRYLDGKRWCDACQQWIPRASMAGLTGTVITPDTLVVNEDGMVPVRFGASAACSVSHLHVHGIRCGVCGITG